MSKRLLFNKPSKTLVIDLINFQNNTTLQPNDVLIKAPTTSPADVGSSNRNTRVTLEGGVNSPLQGSVFVYYNRLDLALLHQREVVGVLDNFNTLVEALSLFNRDYGLNISIDEVEITQPKVDGSLELIIKDSLVFYPGSKVTILPLSTLSSFEGWVDRFWFFTNYTLLSSTAL